MDNLNTIVYDDDWKTTDNPVYVSDLKENTESTQTQPQKKKKKITNSKPLLLITQLIASALMVLAFFLFKTFGGDFYNDFKSWYVENLNNEIILTEEFADFNIDDLVSNEN